MESTSQVINSCLNYGLSQSGQAALPKPAALKIIIRRKRKEVNCAPPVPTNLEEMVIPDPYKYYVNAKNEKELFLLGDSGPVADRILIFGRQKNSKVK